VPETASAEAFVRFKNVQKSYDGEHLVVKNLNLEIAKGEFLTMLGPSGSGKTTCLMMLAGFETATHGEIILDGEPINNVAPLKRDIGMVFQNYALFPHLTVSENLAFPLQVRNINQSEIAERVRKALDMVELAGFGRHRPAQLSGGQQQRVAVAHALVFEPKLVLMDEPLGALDKQMREQMQYEIKHIHESLGVTVVYVTHDQSEALTMSNRIVVFNDGVIQQLATPEALYEEPENAFVAQFVGDNNRLRGTVTSVDADHCLVEVNGGGTVRALPVNIAAVGGPTTLSLRPERITVRPDESQHDNVFEAKVEELIYLGDHVRTRVRLLGSDAFIIKVPNSYGRQHLKVGESVPIGWHARDCRALDAT
jgi:putative spermidine/putrescine transport system ATP-binding protein